MTLGEIPVEWLFYGIVAYAVAQILYCIGLWLWEKLF
jgi:hypothetical protein